MSPDFHTLVLASNNAKKLHELQHLLQPTGLTLIAQGQLDIPEPDEPYATFIENALHKARHASQLSGLPALADDSGLCVHALQGAPGVWSARYAVLPTCEWPNREAQRQAQDRANNELLLESLSAYPSADQRSAHFVCTLVAVRHAHDSEPLVACGYWPGRIASQAVGDGGFGYDPLMWLDEHNCSVAQLSAEQKQHLGHRGHAARALLTQLQQRWHTSAHGPEKHQTQ